MVYIILVVYENDIKLKKIEEIFLKIFKKYSLIIINNGEKQISNSFQGSNRYREFSGYYEGYQKIINKLQTSDLIVFANDTILERRKFSGYFSIIYRIYYYLCKFNFISGLYIIGEMHNIDEKLFKTGLKLKNHISTYFFITNKNTIEKINIEYMNHDLDITFNLTKNTFQSNLLSQNYIDRINQWLIQDKNQKKQWYKADQITLNNLENAVSKAKAIFKEHFLSYKCMLNNVRLIPIYSEKRYSLSRFFLYIINKI